MDNLENRVLRPCNTIQSIDKVPRWKQLGLNLNNLDVLDFQTHPGQTLTSRHAAKFSNEHFKSSTCKNI